VGLGNLQLATEERGVIILRLARLGAHAHDSSMAELPAVQPLQGLVSNYKTPDFARTQSAGFGVQR
jgi:hypothetical protein